MQLEVWVVVDEQGDYAVGRDGPDCTERYEETIQPCADACGLRYVKVLLEVPLPALVEMSGTVPVDAPAGLLSVK